MESNRRIKLFMPDTVRENEKVSQHVPGGGCEAEAAATQI